MKFNARILIQLIFLTLHVVVACNYVQGQERVTIEYKDRIALPKIPPIDPLDSVRLWKVISTQIDSFESTTNNSMQIFKNCLQRSQQLGFNTGMSVSALMLGQGYLRQGDYQQSIEMNLVAARFVPNSLYGYQILSTAYSNIANAYNSLGKAYYAIYYYFRAAHIISTYLEGERIEYIYSNVSSVLPTPYALHYLYKAENIAREKRNDSLLCMILLNQAYHLQQIEPTESNARQAIREALSISKRIDAELFEYRSLVRLGAYFLEQGDTDSAIQYLTKAEQLRPEGDQILSFRNRDLTVFGSAWMQLGAYEKADSFFRRSLVTAEKLNLHTHMAFAYQRLSEIAEHRGSLQEALDYHKNYVQLKDSVLNAQTLANIQDLEIKYRTAEKDREIAQKEQAIEHRNYLIGGITAGGILLLAGLFFYHRHNQQKQKLIQQQQELLRLKALMEGEEIERSRIARELHDGVMVHFSSVKMNLGAVIKRHPNSDQTRALQEIVTQLDDATRELRKSAHNLMPDTLLRDGLIAAVRYFCHSMAQNAGVEIEFNHFGPTPDIPSDGSLMLYRTLQELLQNALKYAAANHIIVQIDNTGDLISLTVEDDGIGFDLSSLDQQHGIGIRNIQSRIRTLGGFMNIESAPGKGTSIYIEIETVSLNQEKKIPHGDKRSNH